ncbi:DNA polymerase III subunits gamma and tau [Spiroplasma sp. TIUS-1]|nr:DNA polymerase III subunit gamma/tau [Spiroplasma sp. TIUS-1]QHX35562.1 DNA polymerase III subunits gamma and tau [Spiroplasma sp. TIUS-1]
MQKKNSLYRYYRPKTFNDVAGHTNLKKILIEQIKNNKFSHALIFSGQRGTGKTSVAKIFAKVINCENPKDAASCETCNSCIQANNNSHPDIFELDAASNNGVDEMRNIRANVSTLPILSKYKVYIIDEFHMLTKSAYNSLLKTLEEPPQHVQFILATTELHKIPLTIISRCQNFNFARITKVDLKEQISKIAKLEGIDVEEKALDEIFYLSEGSLRDAINALEQAGSYANKVTESVLKDVFSIATKEEKIALISKVLGGDAKYVISFFENSEQQGIDFQSLSLDIINLIKEIVEFKMVGELKKNYSITLEEANSFKKFDISLLFDLSDEIAKAYESTKGSSIDSQLLLIALLKVINVSKLISVVNSEVVLSNKITNKEVEMNKTELPPFNKEEKRLVKTEFNKLEESTKTIEIKEKIVDEKPSVLGETDKKNELKEKTKITENIGKYILGEGILDNINPSIEITDLNLDQGMSVEELIADKTIDKLLEEETGVINTMDLDTELTIPINEKVVYDLSYFENLKHQGPLDKKYQDIDTIWIDDAEIVATLLNADKVKRLKFQTLINQIFDISSPQFDPTLAKKLVPLFGAKVLAGSDTSIVLIMDTPILSNYLQYKINNLDFRKHIFEKLDTELIIYSVSKERTKILKEEYVLAAKHPEEYVIPNVDDFYESLQEQIKDMSEPPLAKESKDLFLDDDYTVIK